MVAVDLRHHLVVWQRGVDAADSPDGGQGAYEAAAQLQRTALTLANGRVYA